jgi:hypothetical protein
MPYRRWACRRHSTERTGVRSNINRLSQRRYHTGDHVADLVNSARFPSTRSWNKEIDMNAISIGPRLLGAMSILLMIQAAAAQPTPTPTVPGTPRPSTTPTPTPTVPVGPPITISQPYGQYYDYVYKIQVTADNKLAINVIKDSNVNFSANHSCATPYYAISSTTLADDKVKAWFQLSSSSLLSHTGVYVETQGCTSGATNGYPILTKLQLEELGH